MKDSKKSFSHFFKVSFPYLTIFTFVCLFFYKVIFGQVPLPGDFVLGIYHPWIDQKWEGYKDTVPVNNPILADVVSFTFPMQTLAIRMMKEGQLPLWNPYILGGTPLLANFQSAPFAVTNIVYLFTDILTGWSLRIILQHLLASVFTYWLLRHWKISKLGSVFGGVFFAFSGFNMIWSQWNAHVLTASFIPLIILFSDKVLSDFKFKHAAVLSLVIFLQLLSGYPQIVLYTYISVGFLWLTKFKANKGFLKKTIILATFSFLGILLASFQWLPARELLSLSQRSVEPHPFSWAFLPFQKIITFIAPDYFGNHATSDWWGPQDYTSNTGFVAVVPLLFCLIAIFSKGKKVIYLLSLLLVSLLLSFPTPLSIFLWKSGLLGLQAASAHRALVIMNLAVALLAGFGIDVLLLEKRYKTFLPFLLLTVFFSIFVIFAFTQPVDQHFNIAIKNLFLPLSAFLLSYLAILFIKIFKTKNKLLVLFICLIGTVELFHFGWEFTPFVKRNLVFPSTPVIETLKNIDGPFRTTGDTVIPINLRMNYGISSLEGYDAVYPERTSKFLTALNHNSLDNALGRYGFINDDTSDLLSISNVKYILALSEKGSLPDRFKNNSYEVYKTNEPSVILLKNTKALDRSKIFYNWKVLNEDSALKAISEDGFKFDSTVVLSDMPSAKIDVSGQSEVLYTKYTEMESVMEVRTSENGLLYTSDSYYPGWKAYIDGKEVPIIRANYLFRVIEIPKGKHLVRYIYAPSSFRNGLIMSFISLSAIFVVGILFSRSKVK